LELGEKEDLSTDERKKYDGKVWYLTYDWKEVSRCFEHRESGDRIWPKNNKSKKSKDRINHRNAQRIFTDLYLQQKIALVQKTVRCAHCSLCGQRP